MKQSLLTPFICFLLLSSGGCRHSSSRALRPVDMVPSSSFVVLAANWREVRKDDVLKRMLKADALARIYEDINIESEQINDLALFGDDGSWNRGRGGIIISGSYQPRALMNQMKTRGWAELDYNRYKLYQSPAKDCWLTILRRGMVVVGTRPGVERVIDVEMSPRTGITSRQPFDRLISNLHKKRHSVVMILAPSQEFQDMAHATLELSSLALDLAGVGPLGGLISQIGMVKGLGVGISRNGNHFPTELGAVMRDESAASFVSGTINLFKSASSLAPSGNLSRSEMETPEAYRDMKVTRERDTLYISMTLLEKDMAR